ITQCANKRCAVVAPTGVAAVNAGGVTIHSFFQLPFCPYLPDIPELITEYQMPDKMKQMRKQKANIIRTLELLIIDEISMVRADLLDAIDYSLRRYRRNHRPFGGVQLLMIGDIHQLPPVVTESEMPYMNQVYPSPFFFHSKALQQIPYITIELQTVYRQQDEHFVSLLNKIRDGIFDEETLKTLNQRVITDTQDKTASRQRNQTIRLTTHNHQADTINSQRLRNLKGKSVQFNAIIEGNFPISNAPTEQTLELKKGAQVMFVKNDSSGNHNYYNGKIGTVERFGHDDDGMSIVVRDEHDDLIFVKPEQWENIKYEIDPNDNQIKQITDGTFTQYPLRLAWAITIHKAQGLTFDHVIVDAASAFAYGQVYVALSRCRSLQGLELTSPITAAGAIGNNDVLLFDRTRPTEESVREVLQGHQTQFCIDLLSELFETGGLHNTLERISRLMHEKLSSTYSVQTLKLDDQYGKLTDLNEVSTKFHRQIVRMISSGEDTTQRIAKGCDYFITQLKSIKEQLHPIFNISIDNQETKKIFADYTTRFRDILELKLHCMTHVQQHGFDINDYQKVKVDYILSDHNEKQDSKKGKTTNESQTYANNRNPQLVRILSQWRRNLSADLELPAYAIMSQKSLLSIADKLPTTEKDLLALPGIGKMKLKQFGSEILQIIQQYIAHQKK
ncbi:MAG: HRDC domain-containing protein, partial [Bacteroidales bacterium]|nr:HRDC domain-containing protein [Candidatus Colimorpha onthohippi]